MEAMTLTRPDQFRAIGDSTRMRILGLLAQTDATIQELARSLRMPKGTVSHHVGVLEDAGLIRVVEERRVRAVTERRYARVAPMFRLGDSDSDTLTDPSPDAGSERHRRPDSRPDQTLHLFPLRHALEEAVPQTGPADASSSLIVRARMPAARARRFGQLVEQLAQEFAEGAPGLGETYGFVAAIYATDWQPGKEDT